MAASLLADFARPAVGSENAGSGLVQKLASASTEMVNSDAAGKTKKLPQNRSLCDRRATPLGGRAKSQRGITSTNRNDEVDSGPVTVRFARLIARI